MGSRHTEGAAGAEPLGCAGVLGSLGQAAEWKMGDVQAMKVERRETRGLKAVGCEFSMQESPGQTGEVLSLDDLVSCRMRCCPRGWSSTGS